MKLATDALDEVRREVRNDARKGGQAGLARELKGARFALWMSPERLTERHQQKLARVQENQQGPVPCLPPLPATADHLPRSLRTGARAARGVAEAGKTLPAAAVRQARKHDHPAFPDPGSAPARLVDARTEQVKTQIRLITRRGFGYHSPWAVIALAMLSLGGLCPPLPGR